MEPERSNAVTPQDCQISVDLPAHIQEIVDPDLKQQASDTWKAATTVLRGIALFRKWIDELEQTGDAHPSVPRRLLERIDFALRSLCRSGIALADFQPDREAELLASFPGYVDPVTSFNDGEFDLLEPPQLGPFAPWQIRYRSEYRENERLWWRIEGCVRTVLELLTYPTTAFRTESVTGSDDDQPRGALSRVDVGGQTPEPLMTLEQLAKVVGHFRGTPLAPKTLRDHAILGAPAVDSKGGRGKTKRWNYEIERPRLEKKYRIALPDVREAYGIFSKSD